MKYWKTLGYLVYAALLFGYLFLANYLTVLLIQYNSEHFNIAWLIALAVPVSYIILGCLLGLGQLVRQARKDGTWSVAVARLLILGLPSLYFSFYWSLYFLPLRKPILPSWLPQQFFTMAAAVFGYVLITSFKKYYQGCTTVRQGQLD